MYEETENAARVSPLPGKREKGAGRGNAAKDDARARKDAGYKKLRKMRIIATSLLAFMTVAYFIFKRYESSGILYSSIAAFSEAAMIGALADWFAVVALFRHPLGISWVPHTAIIQKSKDRIADSLSGFVVDNFFTEEVIESRLGGIDFSSGIISYLKENEAVVSKALVNNFPTLAGPLLNSDELASDLAETIKNMLRGVELYPFIGNACDMVVSSGYHIPALKAAVSYVCSRVRDDREGTIRLLEDIDGRLALPVVRNMVYKAILQALERQAAELGSDRHTEINSMVTETLPKVLHELKTSPSMIERGEKLKNDFLDSELFGSLLSQVISEVKTALIKHGSGNNEDLEKELGKLLNSIAGSLRYNDEMRNRINLWVRESIIDTVKLYRSEISGLISDTVRDWKLEDMVDKLECQVGGDLQYIRINGTVIGGLAGLCIHLAAVLLHL